MRSILAITGVLIAFNTFGAETDRERRVRIALTLSAVTDKPCHYADWDTAKKEALETGKPILVFVGVKCSGRCGNDEVQAVVTELQSYDRDVKPRIVVLSRGKGDEKGVLVERGVLPPDATEAKIEEVKTRAYEQSQEPLDWQIAVLTEDAEYAEAEAGDCPNGVCPAPAFPQAMAPGYNVFRPRIADRPRFVPQALASHQPIRSVVRALFPRLRLR